MELTGPSPQPTPVFSRAGSNHKHTECTMTGQMGLLSLKPTPLLLLLPPLLCVQCVHSC